MAIADSPPTGWRDRVTDPEDRAVFEALADEDFDFRTLQGLVDVTGLSPDRVQAALERHSDLVRLSAVPGPNGEALYTLSSRPVTTREQLALAQSVIASPVS